MQAGNVVLTTADMAEVAKIMEQNPVHGHRYLGEQMDLRLWG